jgi:nucleoside-diphosphate-sugar epimerase
MILVTGATGLLGSHIAERLVAQGHRVRAFTRPTSDVRFLKSLGVEPITGDLTSPQDCAQAVRGIEVVYHAAAKVGDWGAWREFQTGVIDATSRLARAAIEAGVQRFVHISSTSAYGHPPEGGAPIDETAPLGQGLWPVWDGYTRAKVEAERLLWELAETKGLPLTVIRPSWLFGERDRTTTARWVERMLHGGIPTIGPGDNPFSAVYAGVVAEAALLAASDPGSVGEAYNITDQGPITQREFLDLLAEVCGVRGKIRSYPYPVVFGAAFLLEALGRLTSRRRPPLITRYATWLMGRRLAYSTAKARSKLGWSPSFDYRASLERTVLWYQRSKASVSAPSP